MQRSFDRFGRAMAMVVNILDPDVIVLGGGLSNVERLYSEGRDMFLMMSLLPRF